VFAPTNDAFTAASGVIATLTDAQVTDVLTYHVVPNTKATAADLTEGESLSTVFTPHDLTVATISPNVTIHPDGADATDATVTQANNMATNGVVHIIDAVLVPALTAPGPTTPGPTTPGPAVNATTTTGAATMTIVELASSDPDLSTLADLLSTHNLIDTLSGTGPFTVFAPTNAAFTAAQPVIVTLSNDQITDVLTYHVVAAKATAADLTEGEVLPTVFATHNLTVSSIAPTVIIHPEKSGASDATVTAADIMATNGVIHKVDAVLVPLFPTGPTAGPTTPAPVTTTAAATLNIVELAQSVPELSTLVDLLISNNLTDTLSGPGPFTVFAPTNDAFTAAADVIATLTAAQVTEVLTYHVVPDAKATAADLTEGEVLATVFTPHELTVATISPDVTIHPDGANATNAKVTQPNNMATNGVVHIIDAVLVPDLTAASFNIQVV
jgi:transforming growth factor-beta-induced protein